MKEIPIPDQYTGNYVDLIGKHFQSSEDVTDVNRIVSPLCVPLGVGDSRFKPSEQHPEEMELKLWPD